MTPASIALEVNGERVEAQVLPRLNLADFLREHLHLTGTHVGCEHGVCGACTVRLNGEIVRACLMLAVQADGGTVETIEGLSDSNEVADLQEAFRNRNALQCGYCTPGMLIAAQDLLKQNADPSREQIREHLSGNYCRCTGYQAIVDAVEITARSVRPTRKALVSRILEGDGLVRIVPGKGATVTKLTRDEIVETYDIRVELEGLGTRIGMRHLNDAVVARIGDVLEEMGQELDSLADFVCLL